VSYAFAHGVSRTGFEYQGELVQVAEYIVESDYVDVMGMNLVAGRNFDPRLATDSSLAVIVNETLVRDFGWTDPLGQALTGMTGNPATDPVVVGIVQDFHFKSLHEQIEPMMLTLSPHQGIQTVLARIRPDNVPATLDLLRATWQRIAPGVPFQYSFLDDDINQQYRAEERWSQIVGYGAGFAILIACLGLFGLAALSVAGRTKEIGIRKVLGATLANIAVLLSKDFAWLVLAALVFAAPAAYFTLRAWLDNFAYRIEIGPDVFLIAGGIALGIALLTVSYHAIKAALADPVKSLRYE
jgi:putative ABC transport system permease protein